MSVTGVVPGKVTHLAGLLAQTAVASPMTGALTIVIASPVFATADLRAFDVFDCALTFGVLLSAATATARASVPAWKNLCAGR